MKGARETVGLAEGVRRGLSAVGAPFTADIEPMPIPFRIGEHVIAGNRRSAGDISEGRAEIVATAHFVGADQAARRRPADHLRPENHNVRVAPQK